MPQFKVGSSAVIMLGPVTKSSDGVTANTTLALTTAPAIKISKSGSTFVNRDSTQAVTHRRDGNYTVPLSSDDMNTEGYIMIAIASSHSTGAVPTWEYHDVLAAQWWDSMYSTADYLKVDAVQIEGTDASDQVTALVWDTTLESTVTMKQAMRLISAFAAGISTGAGSTTLEFYGVGQSTIARITAQCGSSGNRKAVTYATSS